MNQRGPNFFTRYKFRTGMTDHPGDILVNATVEALTQKRKEEWDHRKHQGKSILSS